MAESLFPHAVQEGEDLHGRVLLAAHGSRRWKAERVVVGALRMGYASKDAVYALLPQGGDTYSFGGVKRIVRSENQLIAWGWEVIA